MRLTLLYCCCSLLLLTCGVITASAQGEPEPTALRRGGPERRAIIDALRAPVEKTLGRQVIFKVDHLKVRDGWAFLRGVPRQASGAAMDYRGTKYQQAIRNGAFDDWICALLRKRGGQWRVVRYVIGATDVAYEGWDKEYKAPSDIFKE